jgi:hypothetical protein
MTLSEEIYRFAGNRISIKSNSVALRRHLRAVYGRFYEDHLHNAARYNEIDNNTSLTTIEILDDLANSNELTIQDSFFLYKISRDNGSYRWISEDLATRIRHAGICEILHFVQTIVLRTITLLMSDYHLFHAGVVSWRNKGLIIPAHPNMGKTTLVTKLVMTGCKFLSDEIACFTPDLDMLEAFPRRLSIRNDSRKILGLPEWEETMDVIRTAHNEWMLDIEDIVPDSFSESCYPHSIFFLRGFDNMPRLERISRSDSLLELLKFTYCAVDDPSLLFFKCAPLINKLQCYNLVSGSPDETAKRIIEAVESSAGKNE